VGGQGIEPKLPVNGGSVAEVVLFHHVQGLTPGVEKFGAELRGGGHVVHVPDLFEGERPATIPDGIALVQRIGEAELLRRTERVLDQLPQAVVYAGFSFGSGVAQRCAQGRPGARGALLYEACLPTWAVGSWPAGVPLQVHGMDRDPYFALSGDLEAARELVEAVGPDLGELFVYEGDRHLFADSSLDSYDPVAAALMLERSLRFLSRVG